MIDMKLSDKELEQIIKDKKEKDKLELSKEEKEKNIIEWTTFY